MRGVCDQRFSAVREVFAENLKSGADLGASVAVVERGSVVVDLCGGFTTQDRDAPWTPNTIANVYSTTKPMVALVALMLIDRGEIAPDDRVAKYWPEFAKNGKEDITIAHLMSHTSGLPAWDPPFSLADLYDWQVAVDRLADMTPWWKPGTAIGYHVLNYGHLIGEVVRRVTGQSLGEFFKREIAEPLGIDFHIGLHPSHHHRVSPVFLGEGSRIDISQFKPDSYFIRTQIAPNIGGPENTATHEWRVAEIGAANGHGNALSVALAQSAMTNEGVVNEKKLISQRTIELAGAQQVEGVDLVLQVPMRFGLGFALASPHYPVQQGRNVLYWGGFGGSRIIHLPDEGITFAYVMNKLQPGAILGEPRGDALFGALLASLN